MPLPETKFLIACGAENERRVVADALLDMGYRNLSFAENGPQALNALSAGNAFFTLAAWELPQLGGLRLTKRIRSTSRSANSPCVLIVPHHDKYERAMSEGAGVTAFLPRPLTRNAVSARVEQVLSLLDASNWPDRNEDRAEALAEGGDLKAAEAEYNRALDAGRRRLAGIHTEIGAVFYQKGHLDQAIDHLERAAMADPYLPRNREILGRAYMDVGRPSEALRNLERAAELDPGRVEVKRDLAECFLLTEQYHRAEELFEGLLKNNPKDKYLLNRLGMALRKQKKFPQALQRYKQALELGAPDEHLYFNMGRCYLETGEMDAAEAVLNRALRMNPGLEEAKRLASEVFKRKNRP